LAWDRRQRQLEEEEAARRKEEAERLQRIADENRDMAMETGSVSALETAQRHQKAALKLIDDPVEVKQTMRFEAGTVAQTTHYEWEIVDEKQIPKEFWILDEKKLNAVARKFSKEPQEIPGVKFVKKSGVSITT
jgi:hypothetical protein